MKQLQHKCLMNYFKMIKKLFFIAFSVAAFSNCGPNKDELREKAKTDVSKAKDILTQAESTGKIAGILKGRVCYLYSGQ